MNLTSGEVLAMHRRNKKITQESVRKKLSISKQTIVNWEGGATKPSTEQMIDYCEIIELDPKVIIETMVMNRRMIPNKEGD